MKTFLIKKSAITPERYKKMIKVTNKRRKASIDEFIFWGIYFGYPDCCIKHGIKRKLNSLDVSEHGFILCKEHGKQAINGIIKPKDLIKDRICKNEFPENDYSAFLKDKKIKLSGKQYKKYNRIKKSL